jgi:ABC-type transport system involved in multi-copper enzyme maturation permease subunit
MARVLAVMFNTYREAVRARLLHGLFAVAIATAFYSAIVGEFASRSKMRVVSDLGAASISLYGIIVAVVIASTSLYRELELKTIFPILARPIRRGEYLVGKYLGAVFTMTVFITANVGVLLLALAFMADQSLFLVLGIALGSIGLAFLIAWRIPRARTYAPAGWALAIGVVGWFLAAPAPDDRGVVVFSAMLTVLEVGVVSAMATVIASFSSPFLTAVCTFGLFVVGRSADTMAHLPVKVFGAAIQQTGVVLSKVFPNLMLYVPPRPLLVGDVVDVTLPRYLLDCSLHAVAWSVGLMALATLIFKRRDFI